MLEKDGWNSVFIENHDNPRSVPRYTDDSDQNRDKGAKLLALMQTTLGGTLFVYQGEEIGIRNAPKSWDMAEYKDIETINYWKKCKQLYTRNEVMLDFGRKAIHMKARDHARTPMHWSSKPNAGFCDPKVKPWMKVMDDFETINAESQIHADDADALSTWQFWQRGLHDRKKHSNVFVYGDFEELSPEHPDIFAYVRTSEAGEKWLIVLNFSGKKVQWTMSDSLVVDFWACSNYTKGRADKPSHGAIELEAWEGVLGLCK
jgi:oligo-1,6-glucosidase